MENTIRTLEEIMISHTHVDVTLKVGDYVFASKFLDASPFDRWRIDIIERIDLEHVKPAIFFKETGNIPFFYAQQISINEGKLLIALLERNISLNDD